MLFITAAITAVVFTSCLKESDPADNTVTAQGYCTFEGTWPTYIAHFDGGGTATFSTEAMTRLGEKGFASKRAWLYISFREGDATTNETTNEISIKNANIYDGELVPVAKIMTEEEMTEKNLNVEDSLFTISRIKEAWGYRGYITTVVNGSYSYVKNVGKRPTINLVYDGIEENSLKLKLCYNRHSEKNAQFGNADFNTSFSLEGLSNLIPGTDSVKVTISAKETTDKVFKISRKDFYGF